MNIKTVKKSTALALGIGALVAASPLNATQLVLFYDIEFSGAQTPSGPAPWLIATFDDDDILTGASDEVRLTLETIGLTSPENISEWLFNFDDSQDVTDLAFTLISGSNPADDISLSMNDTQHKADGDGFFDIQLNWDSSDRLAAGETLVYDISGISGLDVSDFNFLSSPTGIPGGSSGGHGPFLSAAHAQSLPKGGNPTGGSGWLAPVGGGGQTDEEPVPEIDAVAGTGALAFLAGALALMSERRRAKVV